MAPFFESIRMRFPLLLTITTLALPFLAQVSARAQAPTGLVRSNPDSILTTRFAGCYQLSLAPRSVYRLRLTQRRASSVWDVRAYGLGARNAAGDSWRWSPTDTMGFRISWNGIDSAMEFDVVRRGGTLVTQGTMYQAGAPDRIKPLDAHIRRITCPATVA
jgi:hypothetical protein